MYNSIAFFNKNSFESNIQILLSKYEFDNIKNEFFWCIGPENFIINSEDSLSGEQLIAFEKIFSNLINDVNLKNYDIQFSRYIYFFTLKEELNKRFYPFKKGPIPISYDLICPNNGRPMILNNLETHYLEWYSEFGLFKSIDMNNENKNFFIHPITKKFMFKDEKEFEAFRFEFDKDKLIPKVLIENDQLFVRVINVYDKKDKTLIYRIINSEFFMSGLDSIIIPYEGDELLYFRSYRITNEISNYIGENFNEVKIDFNFDKYEYYLEVLKADDFVYSYNEFVKDLNVG